MAPIDVMRIYGDVDGEGGCTSLLAGLAIPLDVGMRARGGSSEMREIPSQWGGRKLYSENEERV